MSSTPSGPEAGTGPTTCPGWSITPTQAAEYTSIRYTERLAEAGAKPSIGSVGDSFDNAMAESIIGLFKTEVIGPEGPWESVEHVEIDTLEWVHWFNTERPHESIDDLTPIQAEEVHHAARNRLIPTG